MTNFDFFNMVSSRVAGSFTWFFLFAACHISSGGQHFQKLDVNELKVEIEQQENADNIVVSFINESIKPIIVYMKDATGKVIFREIVKDAEKWKKVYVLSSLPKGDYLFKVSDGISSFDKNIQIRNRKTLHPESGKVITVGFSELDNEQAMEFIVQNKTGKDVSVEVFNQKGEKLQHQALGNTPITKGKVRLRKFGSGNFKVKIGTKETLYTKKVTF